MFKILVADDEDIIRKGIIAILRRELDADICYLEAENGLEAMKLCKEHLPQIAITDIRMPFCDGLNFIKNLTEAGQFLTFIIISGYADFEYAKSAIKLGVKEYLLKPINKQELVSLVGAHVKSLKSQNLLIKEKVMRDSENRKVAEKVKERVFNELLNCTEAESAERSLVELAGLGVRFHKELLICAVIQYEENEENKNYIDFAVKNIIDEVLTQEENVNFFLSVQYDSGRIVAVFEGLKRDSMLLSARQALNKVAGLIRKYLKVDVFIGIGDVVYGSILLYKSFKSACEAVNFKIYGTAKNVQLFSEISIGAKCEAEDFSKIIQSLEDTKSSEVITAFEKMINLPPSLQSLSAIRHSYSNLIETISQQLDKYNSANAASTFTPPKFIRIWSFMQLKREIVKYLKEVNEFACEAKIDVSNKKLIVDVLRYVKENAAGDINLNLVAEYFDRTPAYVSALFKKGTGMGFNEYLTSIRMEMAREMISDTSIPIGEVSSLCGYPNSKYFSVVFKNTFGQSPVSYRQNQIRR